MTRPDLDAARRQADWAIRCYDEAVQKNFSAAELAYALRLMLDATAPAPSSPPGAECECLCPWPEQDATPRHVAGCKYAPAPSSPPGAGEEGEK